MQFYVKEPHLGDKQYNPGDTREAEKHEVQHLIDLGILSEEAPEDGAKADAAPSNKSEGGAPENKSETK